MTTETVEEAGADLASASIGAAGAADAAPATGRIGRYRLLEQLGEGGMGVVHRAYDEEVDRMVALKIVRTRATSREEARERLLREGRAIARLHHPNVVKVHEVGLDGGRLFLAMELVRGATLKDWLAEGARSWRDALPILIEAGEGLAAAHDAGLVHRDFKPANVLIGRDGRVRVADFGLARSAAAASPPPERPPELESSAPLGGVTQMGTVLGTPAYMAPEQHLGEAPGPRADQFAFCVALWEAVHGARPFAGSSRQELMSNIARGRATPQRRRIPRWLQAVMMRGLRADPELRYRTMHDLLRDLRRRPIVARWSRIALASTAAIAVAGGLGFQETLRGRQVCAREAARLVAGWDGAGREIVDGAFARSPSATATAVGHTIVRALDQHARALELTSREACEAGGVRGEERREVVQATEHCLRDHAADLDAFVSMIAESDEEARARSIDALALFGTASRCRRAEWVLRAYPYAGSEAVVRVRALVAFGRFVEAEREAAALVEAGGDPESWVLRGLAQAGQGERADATESMWQATWAAEATAKDAVGARAWVELARLAAEDTSAPVELQRRARLAEHALARAGGDDALALRLALALAQDAIARGRPHEAVAMLEAAPASSSTVALELLEQRALASRGLARLATSQRDEAASDLVRALAIATDLYGQAHPRVAEVRTALDRALANGP